jgi:hypothetical protein
MLLTTRNFDIAPDALRDRIARANGQRAGR